MRTPVSTANPFGATRYGYLWESLRPHPGGRHIDYGAYDGRIVAKLVQAHIVGAGIGVDVNLDIVRRHQAAMPAGARLVAMRRGELLPFDDASFDSASVLDVIEHIVDQKSVLDELHRVLCPGGALVVTVPRRHMFSCLDPGNLKFLLPRLHERFYTWRYGIHAYRARYVDCKDGLFGDIEVGKGEHQHFRPGELVSLVQASGFDVLDVDGAGLFARPLLVASHFSPTPIRRLLGPAVDWDARTFGQAHLFLTARRT